MTKDGSPPPAAPPGQHFRRRLPRIALALVLGVGGGALFKYLALPLPWMIGAMAFVTVAALSGANVEIPRQGRNVMITVLGIMLGSGFTPDIVSRMPLWTGTMAALALWAMLSAAIGLVYFRKVAGYDPATAFFSATPGGLNEMTIVGGQMGGDERTISLTHAVRVLLVVFTIPIWYRLEGHMTAAPPSTLVGLFDLDRLDVAVLAICAVAGAMIARHLKIPAAFLVGPMILSAAVHLSGLIDSQPPYVLVSAAQVAIGAAVGCRFAGLPLAVVARTAAHAAITAVGMLAMTVAFAFALAQWTGINLAGLILAFAPGGLAEMSLIALALGVDVAFVASHHIARIMMIVTLAPLWFRWSQRRRKPPAG